MDAAIRPHQSRATGSLAGPLRSPPQLRGRLRSLVSPLPMIRYGAGGPEGPAPDGVTARPPARSLTRDGRDLRVFGCQVCVRTLPGARSRFGRPGARSVGRGTQRILAFSELVRDLAPGRRHADLAPECRDADPAPGCRRADLTAECRHADLAP